VHDVVFSSGDLVITRVIKPLREVAWPGLITAARGIAVERMIGGW
jgi:hypothetical protein